MTVRAPQLQPVPVRLKDMAEGRLADWGHRVGLVLPDLPDAAHRRRAVCRRAATTTNLPVDMALADGAEEIVAVELHPGFTHPEYARMPFLTTIQPLHDLGGFLDFNPKLLARARRLGYCDAMKAYRALDGVRYSFFPALRPARGGARAAVCAQGRRVRRRIRCRAPRLHSAGEGDAPLASAIRAETPLRALSWKDASLRGLELCAQRMGFREDAIYDADALTKRMLEFARVGEAVERADERGVRLAARMGPRELISYLYRALAAQGEFPADCVRALAEYPAETAAALYLRCAEEG